MASMTVCAIIVIETVAGFYLIVLLLCRGSDGHSVQII